MEEIADVLKNFNPRTHEECDPFVSPTFDVRLVFQSTHSRGVRLMPILDRTNKSNFNPRTHEECDGQRRNKS